MEGTSWLDMSEQPKNLGGELPWSVNCYNNYHERCKGSWTQYPDERGTCECPCHQEA